eukprot:2318504-Amphidinium_carterae.1
MAVAGGGGFKTGDTGLVGSFFQALMLVPRILLAASFETHILGYLWKPKAFKKLAVLKRRVPNMACLTLATVCRR